MKAKIYLLTLLVIFSVKFVSGQINLNYFTGNQSSTNIDLSWQSATEINMDYYSVERSIDSINFISVQNVTANQNTSSPRNYVYTDIYSFADICYYYRLKSIHFNGAYEYSDIIKICYNSALTSVTGLSTNLFFDIYPNPVTNGLLNIQMAINKNCTFNIFNQIGQNVFTTKTISTNMLIDCRKFNSGLYYFQVINNNGQTKTEKFIIE